MDQDGVRRFRTRDALADGITASRLRTSAFRHPFHGVYVTAERSVGGTESSLGPGSPEPAHVEAALDYATRMGGDAFFSHVTAAVIWGMPLPPSVVRGAPVHVGVIDPARLPRGRGVRGHQAPGHLVTLRVEPRWGLRVTSPAATWAMLPTVLHDDRDLIAAADGAVRSWRVPRPIATIAELESAVAAGRRVGVGRLRDALPLVRTRSASRPETRARLTLIDAGLPEPALNHDVWAAGAREACVDLAYPRQKIAIEYEGEHHLLDPRQWERDIRRYERLAELGWLVIRVTKIELFDAPHLFVARVRRALRAAEPGL